MTCSVCPRKFKPVPGHGPCPAGIAAIGERPGLHELRQGVPFVGPSGQEWNQTYLPLAGLNRADLYVSNAVKCYAKDNRTPTPKETEACASYWLPGELRRAEPRVVLLLGATAASLVPGIRLEVDHGRPFEGRLYGWEGWIVPMYHPALGLHETSNMSVMLQDWERLKPWLEDGAWIWPEDEYPNPDYSLAGTEEEIDRYFELHSEAYSNMMAIDTENHGGRLFSIQVSIEPGSALMVKDGPLRAYLNDYIESEDPVIFHHAPADLPWFNGLRFPYRDTMQECYHLGLPQGLKTLGWQLFGVRMQSWEDLVGAASRTKQLEWLAERLWEESQRPDIVEKNGKKGIRRIEKPSTVYKTIERIFKHGMKSPDYDLESRLLDLGLKAPEKGIGHVPEKEAVEYACRDADLTLRLALRLDEIRQRIVDFGVSEEDRDR